MTREVEPGGSQGVGRAARWPWVVVAVAAVVAAASTVYFWLNRPRWGYCVDGEDFGFCDTGVFSSNAIVGTVILAVALGGLIVVVRLAREPGRGRAALLAGVVFAVLLITAWVLQFVALEAAPTWSG